MSRRARPTLRALREDLTSDWDRPFVLRALEAGEISAVHPLSALQHPILQKASDSFDDIPEQDSSEGPIASVSSEVLLEIKQGQWRAGVWIDDEACWVVVAGLAKGGHKDRHDFYKRLERIQATNTVEDLLPTAQDRDLLKKERAHAVISAWQLQNQEQILAALSTVLDGGTATISIKSPIPGAGADEIFASVDVTVAVCFDPDYTYEDVVVEVDVADRWKNSKLVWPFTTQLLATISPPEQEWEVAGGIFSNLLEIGSLSKQFSALRDLTARHEIATTVIGRTAHYAHRRNLAEQTVEGHASRALCGVYFVPRQDVETLDTCPTCASLHKELLHD